MPKKNKADKEKRAALREKRRRRDLRYCFKVAGPEIEEMKKESAARRQKSYIITMVVFLALCFAGLVWARIDASLYTKVGATITNSYSVKRQIPIFASRTSHGGLMPYYEEWAKVEYTYNDIEYKSRVRLTKDVQGTHIMVYCKKNHPHECRMTRLKYPMLDTGIMIIFGVVLVIGLCV